MMIKKSNGFVEERASGKQADRFPVRFVAPKAPEHRTREFVDSCGLPAVYNTTRLHILARDPFSVHAYWEISQQSIDEMRQRMGAEFDRSAYTLRMYDITAVEFNGHNANHYFDNDFAPHITNWYVNLWCDHVSYCAEVGMRTQDGRFFAFTRSNCVTTPRSSMSDRTEMIWMDVKDNKRQPFVYTWARAKRLHKALSSMKHLLSAEKKNGRKVYLSEEDIRQYYASLFPVLRRVRRSKLPKNIKGQPQGRNRWQGLSETADQRFYVPGMTKDEYFQKFFGASAELARKAGASEAIFSGASEQLGGKKRKFFFELWVELIVHGRTESDAEVRHGDRIVKLRDDGTFTMRFALPDGKVPLDFTATSADKVEQRRIATAVERFKTLYSP